MGESGRRQLEGRRGLRELAARFATAYDGAGSRRDGGGHYLVLGRLQRCSSGPAKETFDLYHRYRQDSGGGCGELGPADCGWRRWVRRRWARRETEISRGADLFQYVDPV